MNRAIVGWALAAAALAVGGLAWGWRGIVLAVSGVVFWLLLQLTRSLRAMRRAAQRPVGFVDSAVMLHAKLARGMQMLDVLKLTGSLGRRVDPARDDRWAWVDAGGAEVVVTFEGGGCVHWELRRPEGTPE